MKFLNNSMIWSLILCAGLVVSCKDDDEPGIPGGLALDKTEIAIGPEGGTERVQVTSSTNWVSSVSAPWVSVSPANGFGSVASVLTVDSTFENTARTLEVRYTPQGQQPQTLTVTQFGFGKQILIKEAEVELESSANYDERVVDGKEIRQGMTLPKLKLSVPGGLIWKETKAKRRWVMTCWIVEHGPAQ